VKSATLSVKLGLEYRDPEAFEKLPPMLITFEEAQRLLSRKDEKRPENIFAKIAREGRKFKVGLCAISQQPKLIDPEVLSQFNTIIVLGLSDPKDRDMVRNCAKQDVHALDNEIQTLMPGEGITTSPFIPFPVPARFHLYEEFVKTPANSKKERGSNPDPGFY
jgi:DNA helicase HerA-like ATPase